MSEKILLVTDANRGIGAAVAHAAAEGYHYFDELMHCP
jgi:NAD(P)-dependent dehydrogenase (short-subunit alcohol dehydrogenase family)